MEFKIDSHLLSQLGLQRTDAVGLVKKWGLDRHYNPYAPARSLTLWTRMKLFFLPENWNM